MKCQVEENEHFRHLPLFAFKQSSKSAKAAPVIFAVYRESAIAKRTLMISMPSLKIEKLFVFDPKDELCSGRPVEFDE